MRTWAFIITVGGSLGLLAPAAHAGDSSKPRGLQSVALAHTYPDFGTERAVTTQPVRTTGSGKKHTASIAANHYQVLRNSF
jgi:hypothetical protein